MSRSRGGLGPLLRFDASKRTGRFRPGPDVRPLPTRGGVKRSRGSLRGVGRNARIAKFESASTAFRRAHPPEAPMVQRGLQVTSS